MNLAKIKMIVGRLGGSTLVFWFWYAFQTHGVASCLNKFVHRIPPLLEGILELI